MAQKTVQLALTCSHNHALLLNLLHEILENPDDLDALSNSMYHFEWLIEELEVAIENLHNYLDEDDAEHLRRVFGRYQKMIIEQFGLTIPEES